MTDQDVLTALELLTHHIGKRLQKHGYGAFASNHEAYGILEEERDELLDALRSNDENNIASEFLDVGVTTVIAIASKIAIARESALQHEETQVQSGNYKNADVFFEELLSDLPDTQPSKLCSCLTIEQCTGECVEQSPKGIPAYDSPEEAKEVINRYCKTWQNDWSAFGNPCTGHCGMGNPCDCKPRQKIFGPA